MEKTASYGTWHHCDLIMSPLEKTSDERDEKKSDLAVDIFSKCRALQRLSLFSTAQPTGQNGQLQQDLKTQKVTDQITVQQFIVNLLVNVYH